MYICMYIGEGFAVFSFSLLRQFCFAWYDVHTHPRHSLKLPSSVSGQDEPKSCATIGYPSGQDGAILLTRDYGLCPERTQIIFWCFIPYNQSFIDEACSVHIHATHNLGYQLIYLSFTLKTVALSVAKLKTFRREAKFPTE